MEKIYTKKAFASSLALSILINAVVFALSVKLLSVIYKSPKKPVEVVLLDFSEPKINEANDAKVKIEKKQNTVIDRKANPIIKQSKVLQHKETARESKTQAFDEANNIEKTSIQNLVNNKEAAKQDFSAKNTQNTITQSTQTMPFQQTASSQDYAFLRKLIEKHLTYPYIARRNAYEGTVVISFVIDKNAFRDICVVKSSGYSILDKSAIESIKKIEPLVKLDKNVKIVIPINFRLSDS